MTIAETLLPEFEHEMESTRKLLAVLPEKIESWKPHDKSMDMQRLAGHVAELPGWAVFTIQRDSLDITPYPGQPRGAMAASRDEILRMFDDGVTNARKAIAGASDADLRKNWQLIMSGKTLLDMPRIAVLRSMVMNHLIHHRAQLGVYLRLKNIAIPGMYGPSADDAGPFGASAGN